MNILHQFNQAAEEQLAAHSGTARITKTCISDARLVDGSRKINFELHAYIVGKFCHGVGESINEAIEDCLRCLTHYSGEHKRVEFNEGL